MADTTNPVRLEKMAQDETLPESIRKTLMACSKEIFNKRRFSKKIRAEYQATREEHSDETRMLRGIMRVQFQTIKEQKVKLERAMDLATW